MTAEDAIGLVLERFRAEPSRTWSIIVTLFGDAIVPRGGSVWLGSLLDVFGAMGIDGSVVRTATSRLTSDDWLERHRVGRNAYYRLSRRGRDAYERAAVQVYAGASRPWDGVLRLALLPPDVDKDVARAALKSSGYGSVTLDLWTTPFASADGVPQGGLALEATGKAADLVSLARLAWPLDRLATAYLRFLEMFDPLRAAVYGGMAFAPLEALVVRTLLVHEYRRIILRDPALPEALLPCDWPGARARVLCAALYHPLLPASEDWLSAHARCEEGPLPAAHAEIHQRFRPPPTDI